MRRMEFETVRLDGEGPVRHLVLNRPQVHNAVNAQLVSDVYQALLAVEADMWCNVGAYSVYPWTAGIEALMAGGLNLDDVEMTKYDGVKQYSATKQANRMLTRATAKLSVPLAYRLQRIINKTYRQSRTRRAARG